MNKRIVCQTFWWQRHRKKTLQKKSPVAQTAAHLSLVTASTCFMAGNVWTCALYNMGLNLLWNQEWSERWGGHSHQGEHSRHGSMAWQSHNIYSQRLVPSLLATRLDLRVRERHSLWVHKYQSSSKWITNYIKQRLQKHGKHTQNMFKKTKMH